MSSPDDYLVGFGPDANCTLALCSVEHSVYEYRPSLAANTTFIVLYAVAMACHVVLGLRWKNSRWFMWCMVAGCTSEIIGYSGRVMMYYNPFKFAAFMIQIVCVTCAPVFFCAAIYVTLALTVRTLSPQTARFRPSLFYIVFITSDLTSLVLQAVGGALSTSSSGASQTAIDLALTGLSLQVVTLVIFSALMADYLIRFSRLPEAKAKLDGRMKVYLSALGLAIALILARCAFRVDELSQGYDGPLVKDQGLFIGLEGVLIVLSVFTLCVGHPGFGFRKYVGHKEVSDAEGGVEVQTVRAEKGAGSR